MSGWVPGAEIGMIDTFAAAFGLSAPNEDAVAAEREQREADRNKELAAARKEAERSVAAVQKVATMAAQLATKRPAPDPKAPPPKHDHLQVVLVVAGQLGRHLGAAGATPDPLAALKKVKADADKALGSVTNAVDNARKELAAAEKTKMDKLDDAGKKQRFTDLAADAAGRQIIDGMVDGIGSKASSAADKSFIIDAAKARFDTEFTGDMTTKALPRIYKLMTRVPDSHTKFNDGLKKVNRVQNIIPGSSDYAGGGVINLRCGRAGAAGTVMPNFLKNVDGLGVVNHFDFATLHEVGHSVNGKFPSDQYADWKSEGPDGILDKMMRDKGFGAITGYPPPFLPLYVRIVIADSAKDPSKDSRLLEMFSNAKAMSAAKPTREALLADPAIAKIEQLREKSKSATKSQSDSARRQLAVMKDSSVISELKGDSRQIGTLVCRILVNSDQTPAKAVDKVLEDLTLTAGPLLPAPDWPALSKHAAITWLKAISMKSETSGLWGSPGDCAKMAVGGRVYQEAYKNDWVSYNISARPDAVSNYQFRAGPEWFAELYGVYYSGKLPKNHKYYGWFKDTIDK
jgi:hypothetical protein